MVLRVRFFFKSPPEKSFYRRTDRENVFIHRKWNSDDPYTGIAGSRETVYFDGPRDRMLNNRTCASLRGGKDPRERVS